MSKKVVACLGASSTAARGPYDWIRDLEERPSNSSFRFYRFAAGGDLAYNAVQRLPKVVACRPDYVIVLIGGNDVIASMPKKSLYFQVVLALTKHLPRRPSLEWYRESMQAIVQGLKNNTSAHIALCSSQPWGEDPGFTNSFQGELNRRFAEYNKALRDIASAEAVNYLPFYERMEELLIALPGRAFNSFRILPFYRDIFWQSVLRKSNDEIGKLNGWRFHRDGIHLNSVSGKLLADLVQGFINP